MDGNGRRGKVAYGAVEAGGKTSKNMLGSWGESGCSERDFPGAVLSREISAIQNGGVPC